MKNTKIMIFGIWSVLSMACGQKIKEVKPAISSIYDISIGGLSGGDIHLSDYKGKKMLVVNVASKCGFTGQYEGLQALHEKYGDHLTIIGVPSNQFNGQEPGTHEEIANFCKKNYGVSFLMAEKVDVKGEKQHPLYQWLTKKENNGSQTSMVQWNFQKYLINEKGELEDIFSSATKPLSKKIIAYLES